MIKRNFTGEYIKLIITVEIKATMLDVFFPKISSFYEPAKWHIGISGFLTVQLGSPSAALISGLFAVRQPNINFNFFIFFIFTTIR